MEFLGSLRFRLLHLKETTEMKEGLGSEAHVDFRCAGAKLSLDSFVG